MTKRRPTLDIFLGILLGIVCNVAYVVTAFFTLSSELAAPLLQQWAPNDSYLGRLALFSSLSLVLALFSYYISVLFSGFFAGSDAPNLRQVLLLQRELPSC